MQIQKIQFNKFNDYNRKTNLSNNICFQGGKQQLIAISTDSFKLESAKKLYTKIQKYYQLIGEAGSIKDKKILSEKTDIFYQNKIVNADTDICLSINKGERNTTINLYQKFADPKYKDAQILSATLDKNGQMINGQFFPGTNIIFERDNRNTRRMYSNVTGNTYMPVGGKDREWCSLDPFGNKNLSAEYLYDSIEKGAFEIFLELARLKTMIK